MEFSRLLEDRRSIRAYKEGVEISKEDIEKMKSMSLEERIEYKSKLKSENRYTYDELE